jgi:hypothetical protein
VKVEEAIFLSKDLGDTSAILDVITASSNNNDRASNVESDLMELVMGFKGFKKKKSKKE